jgi:hypothetical protein
MSLLGSGATGRIRREQFWLARTSLTRLVDERLRPLFGNGSRRVEVAMSQQDRASLEQALPASNEAIELRRALHAAVALYEPGFARWCDDHGVSQPVHPLAKQIRWRVLGDSRPV